MISPDRCTLILLAIPFVACFQQRRSSCCRYDLLVKTLKLALCGIVTQYDRFDLTTRFITSKRWYIKYHIILPLHMKHVGKFSNKFMFDIAALQRFFHFSRWTEIFEVFVKSCFDFTQIFRIRLQQVLLRFQIVRNQTDLDSNTVVIRRQAIS